MHSSLPVLAALASVALAHYNFEALIVNGEVTGPYEYVRRTTNFNSPIEDVTSPNMVCNQGGLDADIRAGTSTYTVAPGDSVGFTVASDVGHPGPMAVYMSKAPDGTEASDYLGDGDWFKVYSLTTSEINEQGLQWATTMNNVGIRNFTFTLPDELPSGNYLMRAEHIGLHSAGNEGGAQFYIGCAQVQVTGSGSGTPEPTVQFPGAYTGQESGILIGIYFPVPTSYEAPGPATWPNACEDHTANLDGQESDGDCTGSDVQPGTGEPAPSPVPSSTPTSIATPAPTPTSGPIASPTFPPTNGTDPCAMKRSVRRFNRVARLATGGPRYT
ncbi:glycosyl hydrolase family 61-domain-containing protein [Stachybotrys elegans]|uniref:lytic cellulose monooxygenase (C4-dehydrogenating) n=1 Tax=Stachybotrys elegans TaxID=80388 RepID=A0A8K0WPF7_9HYPO|nr:glycosyl hydrolase family 61-domain-containing protein [Stachybotrys elegans]